MAAPDSNTHLSTTRRLPPPDSPVLGLGQGTGYLTACFALMVGPQGHVVGAEHIPELVASSIENIKRTAAYPLLKEGSLSVHVGGTSHWRAVLPASFWWISRGH